MNVSLVDTPQQCLTFSSYAPHLLGKHLLLRLLTALTCLHGKQTKSCQLQGELRNQSASATHDNRRKENSGRAKPTGLPRAHKT